VTFFEVKILLDDPDPKLRPGMSVRSEILAVSHPQTLALPIQAVVERPPLDPGEPGKKGDRNDKGDKSGKDDKDEEIKVVFRIEGGKARQQPVETGISDDTRVEIARGLKPGESVITGPYRTLRDLRDGDPVYVSRTTETEDRKAGEKEKG
jgi:HlyD family secretion protein